MKQFGNWNLKDVNGIAYLTLDKVNSSQNLLSKSIVEELGDALNEIESSSFSALFICSAKKSGFIAGADASEFSLIETQEQALKTVNLAHSLFDRLESLRITTVALINGHCLGGGLELALACDYRVCDEDSGIRLGLPEVKLGIHPGFGGSVRLPEKIGILSAMNLMLSGRTVNARTAAKMGIIDFSVPTRQLDRTARFLLDKQPQKATAAFWKKCMNIKPARLVIAKLLRTQVAKRANIKHYPAPFKLIDLWEQHGGNRSAMLQAEQHSVSGLAITETSRNLVRIFFLQEELKKMGKSDLSSSIHHVHVIGAGVMGGDIAAWCAYKNISVTLHDRNSEALAKAKKRAYQFYKKKIKHSGSIKAAMDRLIIDTSGDGARSADLIIEAIVENAEAKISVFTEMEAIAKPSAILATNTSSIPLETISTALKNPGRIIGLHFFNPVAKMQLIEIIYHTQSNEAIYNQTVTFAQQIGRLPIPVTSSPGFLVNRILMPYLLEAVVMIKEGIPAPLIDQAALSFGMPMGPIELADTVGLDICLHVADNLTESFGGDVPTLLKQHVEAGDLGKKTGKGFYRWSKNKPEKQKSLSSSASIPELQSRLVFRYLNEAMACLSEEIVENQNHLDAGLVFGTGFAPFLGGPIKMIIDQGQNSMLTTLKDLHKRYGDRFQPNPGWETFELKA